MLVLKRRLLAYARLYVDTASMLSEIYLAFIRSYIVKLNYIAESISIYDWETIMIFLKKNAAAS